MNDVKISYRLATYEEREEYEKQKAAQQGVQRTKSRWAQFLDKLFAAFRR